MSIDYGAKKIGFAIGQLITKKASPLKIIYRKKQNIWPEINNIIKEWEPRVIIVGYPFTNKINNFIKDLDNFIEEMIKRYKNSIEIIKFSERLSTEESKYVYGQIRKSKYNIKKKNDLDDLSACLILQSWFNENMIN
jgi:putative transcription antitermination factor YqgF